MSGGGLFLDLRWRREFFYTAALSGKSRRGLRLRVAPVARPGQRFVSLLERIRSRAGFVRTGATLANTTISALTQPVHQRSVMLRKTVWSGRANGAESQSPSRKAWNYSNRIGRDACVHKLFDGSRDACPKWKSPKVDFPKDTDMSGMATGRG